MLDRCTSLSDLLPGVFAFRAPTAHRRLRLYGYMAVVVGRTFMTILRIMFTSYDGSIELEF